MASTSAFPGRPCSACVASFVHSRLKIWDVVRSKSQTTSQLLNLDWSKSLVPSTPSRIFLMLFLVSSSMLGKAMLNSLRPVSPGRVPDSRQSHSYDYVIQFQEHLSLVFRGCIMSLMEDIYTCLDLKPFHCELFSADCMVAASSLADTRQIGRQVLLRGNLSSAIYSAPPCHLHRLRTI